MSSLRADPSKIAAARSYFERKFAGWTVNDHHETDTISEVFTIEGGGSGQILKIKFARNFLDDYKPHEIEQKLEHWQVGDFLKIAGPWPLLVTRNGVERMR